VCVCVCVCVCGKSPRVAKAHLKSSGSGCAEGPRGQLLGWVGKLWLALAVEILLVALPGLLRFIGLFFLVAALLTLLLTLTLSLPVLCPAVLLRSARLLRLLRLLLVQQHLGHGVLDDVCGRDELAAPCVCKACRNLPGICVLREIEGEG
jgi:hypothetical protein